MAVPTGSSFSCVAPATGRLYLEFRAAIGFVPGPNLWYHVVGTLTHFDAPLRLIMVLGSSTF